MCLDLRIPKTVHLEGTLLMRGIDTSLRCSEQPNFSLHIFLVHLVLEFNWALWLIILVNFPQDPLSHLVFTSFLIVFLGIDRCG